MSGPALRPADAADVARITAIAHAAYGHYVERIGRPPGPLTLDYAAVVAGGGVVVAEAGGEVVGFADLGVADEGFKLHNVAVHPRHQGTGAGRALLVHAEEAALRAGFDEIRLHTHATMTENRALYARIGYEEEDRRDEEGFGRVFLRKRLR